MLFYSSLPDCCTVDTTFCKRLFKYLLSLLSIGFTPSDLANIEIHLNNRPLKVAYHRLLVMLLRIPATILLNQLCSGSIVGVNTVPGIFLESKFDLPRPLALVEN